MLLDDRLLLLPDVADTARVACSPAGPGLRLETCEAHDARRAEAERFVHLAFRRVHRAEVRSFMPTLLTLRDPKGRLCAVAGCRGAALGTLFLERYLDGAIEEVLAARTGLALRRAAIVEIGNFACTSALGARRLLRLLPAELLGRGYGWAAFTATRAVRELLRMFDAPLLELAPATRARAAGCGDDWGRYYEADPRVLAAALPHGCSAGHSPAPGAPRR